MNDLLNKTTKVTRKQTPTRIIVERVYVGKCKMEDVFRPISEEVTRKNIEEKIKSKIGA